MLSTVTGFRKYQFANCDQSVGMAHLLDGVSPSAVGLSLWLDRPPASGAQGTMVQPRAADLGAGLIAYWLNSPGQMCNFWARCLLGKMLPSCTGNPVNPSRHVMLEISLISLTSSPSNRFTP